MNKIFQHFSVLKINSLVNQSSFYIFVVVCLKPIICYCHYSDYLPCLPPLKSNLKSRKQAYESKAVKAFPKDHQNKFNASPYFFIFKIWPS